MTFIDIDEAWAYYSHADRMNDSFDNVKPEWIATWLQELLYTDVPEALVVYDAGHLNVYSSARNMLKVRNTLGKHTQALKSTYCSYPVAEFNSVATVGFEAWKIVEWLKGRAPTVVEITEQEQLEIDAEHERRVQLKRETHQD